MAELSNKKICPKDIVRVILPVEMIPDKAKVTKVKGENKYTLCHDLMLYGQGREPIKVEGFFLVGTSGSINQVNPGFRVCWLVTADDFVDMLQRSWEATPQ